jgi:prophage tail gpP-like protein
MSIPFLDTASVPAVRRPALEVSFGSGSADDWAAALVSVSVEAGLAPSVDVAEVVLAAGPAAPSVAVGDPGSISLGYEDESPATVFTGRVIGLRRAIDGTTRVIASNGGAALAALRVNQSYEQQTAGDIVNDLAGRAGVDAGTVDDGTDFAFYVVDDRRTAYAHVAALARTSALVAWFTPDGALSFTAPPGGEAAASFTYGVDLLAHHATDATAPAAAITTVGEGAAGSDGQDAWSWLVKDVSSVTGTAGQGTAGRIVADASLRSGDAAKTAAQGIADAGARGLVLGRALVPGAPAVAVAGTISISDAPDDALNGTCFVRGLRHRYGKEDGFTTLVSFGKTNGGGGPLGGLL